MSDERLDLTSLRDVTPPEVVRGALRRFRRRAFTTGALVAVSAAAIVGGIGWAALTHHTLAEQIDAAPGVDVGVAFSDEAATTVVERVARLDYGLAIHLYLAAPDSERGAYSYRLDGVRNAEDTGSANVHDFYFVVTPPDDGVVEATLQVQPGCRHPGGEGVCSSRPEPVRTFAIDLTEIGVPDDVWRR